MKLEKIGPYLGWTLAGITLLTTLATGGYKIAQGQGWVISKAGAQVVAQDEAQQKIEPLSLETLEFMLEYKRVELRKLNRIEDKTPDDLEEINDLRDQIKGLRIRIAKLKGIEYEEE